MQDRKRRNPQREGPGVGSCLAGIGSPPKQFMKLQGTDTKKKRELCQEETPRTGRTKGVLVINKQTTRPNTETPNITESHICMRKNDYNKTSGSASLM